VTGDSKPNSLPPADTVIEQVAQRADRKMRSRRRAHRPVWYALGMYGLVGWSVATPAVAGAALGMWLDRKLGDPFSWTLTMLFAGLALGCLNAWFWVKRESEDEDIADREIPKNDK